MIVFVRALGRLLTFVLMVVLALAGLAVAIFSIGGDSRSVSIPALADYLELPALRDAVGDWLGRLEADGPTAWWSVLGGAMAILVGLIILIGYLLPIRERLLTLAETENGRLAARRRALAQAARALAERQRGVLRAKTRARTSRWARGSLSVRADRPASAPAEEVEKRVQTAITPLAEAFGLRTRVRSRVGARVE